MQEKLTALVTGGAGFIGAHLCRQLLAGGYKVINLDNFDDFYDVSIKRENIAQELRHPAYVLCDADIRDKEVVNKIFAEHKPQLIIHLAGMAGVRPSIENPQKYLEVNVQGTLHLLQAAVHNNVKKFIFASSSSVYGDRNEVEALREDMAIYNMISPYAITKKTGEDLCYYFHRQYYIDIIALRFFTVYGPGQRPDLAIHKFVRLISEGSELPMYGNGDTLRDYTYIDDIISGVMGAVALMRKKDGFYEIINLSGKKAITLKAMISQIEKALGKKAHIRQMPMQPGDVFFTKADISKAQRLLSYDPKTPFDKGIAQFVHWYKTWKNV